MGVGGGHFVLRSKLGDTLQRNGYADQKTMIIAAKKIESILGDSGVSYDEEVIEHHGYSEWSTSKTAERPVAVVYPTSTEEVSQIVKICDRFRVPIVPFGAGSSVEGNFFAPLSGISIDFSQMNKIVAFHEDDMDIVVQPGVNWVDMNNQIHGSGLFLPMDPSPTVGFHFALINARA